MDELITMQSKDGSKVSVLSGINHDIEDYWLTKRDRGSFDAFYPGQEVVSLYFMGLLVTCSCSDHSKNNC